MSPSEPVVPLEERQVFERIEKVLSEGRVQDRPKIRPGLEFSGFEV
jgi:hypothetical protein